MAAERNFFHRWWGSSTIGYELEAIWEMSVHSFSNGRVALPSQRRKGILHFLLQAVAEIGFQENVQITATGQVQP